MEAQVGTHATTITARGPVQRLAQGQFNVLEHDVERYLSEFYRATQAAKLDPADEVTDPKWAGAKPLKVTISKKQWTCQLNPGDVVEYVLRSFRYRDKDSPSGFKVGTKAVSMTIISRAAG